MLVLLFTNLHLVGSGANAGSARGMANLTTSNNSNSRGTSARAASAGGSSRKVPHIEVDHAAHYDNISDHDDGMALDDDHHHGYDEDANYDSVEELELIPMSQKRSHK